MPASLLVNLLVSSLEILWELLLELCWNFAGALNDKHFINSHCSVNGVQPIVFIEYSLNWKKLQNCLKT